MDAKKSILQILPEESLFHITISIHGDIPSTFEWVNEDEFQYKGMIYDVVDQQQCIDSLYLTAWADHHEAVFESTLEVVLARLIGTDPFHSKLQQSWSQFLKQLYPLSPGQFTESLLELKRQKATVQSVCIQHQFKIHPPTPPPQLFG